MKTGFNMGSYNPDEYELDRGGFQLVRKKRKPNDISPQEKSFMEENPFLPGVSREAYMAAIQAPAATNTPEIEALRSQLPALRKAHATGNIFEFNKSFDYYKSIKSVLNGEPRPTATPDSLQLQKAARRRQQRTPNKGRTATMLSLGPTYKGLA